MMIIEIYVTTVCIMILSGVMGLLNFNYSDINNCNTSDLLNDQVIKEFKPTEAIL